MKYKKIILLTGNELRHQFFRKAISSDNQINTLISICEDTQLSLKNRTDKLEIEDPSAKEIMLSHVQQRENAERDFFSAFVDLMPDMSNPYIIPKGSVNNPDVVNKIFDLKPDIVVVYGSSLLKGKLVDVFGNQNKILNIHLGLSPYYRGSGTNFWALVNKQPECVGATFMFLDAGIDTGNVIHQIRPTIYENDTPHTIGNRLIMEATFSCIKLIKRITEVSSQKIDNSIGHLYKRSDFSPQSVSQLYHNFDAGMIKTYMKNKEDRDKLFPIITAKDV